MKHVHMRTEGPMTQVRNVTHVTKIPDGADGNPGCYVCMRTRTPGGCYQILDKNPKHLSVLKNQPQRVHALYLGRTPFVAEGHE